MAGEQYLLSGDQLATYTSRVFTYPPPTYTQTMTISGISTLGSSSDRFFFVRTKGTGTQVQNGDWFDIHTAVDDGTGTLVLGAKLNPSYLNATPDAYNNTGAGDTFIVFGFAGDPQYIVSLAGFSNPNPEAVDDGDSTTFIVKTGDDLADGGDGEIDINEIDAASPEAICFVSGTPILTPTGSTNVELLKPGHLVLTLDHGPQRVRWVGYQHVAPGAADRHLSPIRLAAGSLGHGCPSQAVEVSPAHRIFFNDPSCQMMLGVDSVLVPARQLVGQPGIRTRPIGAQGVAYVHIMFDRHEIIWSAGLASESFRPAQHSARTLDDAIHSEIAELFPTIPYQQDDSWTPFALNRPVTRAHEARALMRGRFRSECLSDSERLRTLMPA